MTFGEKGKTMLQEFIAYLEEQVNNGSIYVLGSQGQTGSQITEAWIKLREHNNAYNYNRAIALWKKRLALGYVNLHAYDCSGLAIYWLYNLKKIFTGDLTAHGLYGKCTPIKKADLKVGDWVFRKKSLGRKYHIGYVVSVSNGTLYVIESKGRDDGVVKRPINASSTTYWNAFGRPAIFKTEILNGEESEVEEVVRKGDVGATVTQIQNALLTLGYALPNYGADGDFGSETESAVNKFKTENGLTANGIVDNVTFGRLIDAVRLKITDVSAYTKTISDYKSRLNSINQTSKI